MGVLVAGEWFEDIIALGERAGALTREDTSENKRKFKGDLKAVLKEYEAGEERYPDTYWLYKNINKVITSDEYDVETARQAAREAAEVIFTKSPKELWCVCPELRMEEYSCDSGTGTETRHRTPGIDGAPLPPRVEGKYLPIGGCVCMFSHSRSRYADLTMVLNKLKISKSS